MKIETNYHNTITVNPFDSDKELEIMMDDASNDEYNYRYLSPNKVNELINYLVNCLIEIGEPVDVLKSMQSEITVNINYDLLIAKLKNR